jgi:hypothetical protein
MLSLLQLAQYLAALSSILYEAVVFLQSIHRFFLMLTQLMGLHVSQYKAGFFFTYLSHSIKAVFTSLDTLVYLAEFFLHTMHFFIITFK